MEANAATLSPERENSFLKHLKVEDPNRDSSLPNLSLKTSICP
jgi:hypothetical protein